MFDSRSFKSESVEFILSKSEQFDAGKVKENCDKYIGFNYANELWYNILYCNIFMQIKQ